MSFSSSGLRKIVDGGLTDGTATWLYRSSDPSTAVKATGYFAGCGSGSRGANAFGMKVGDVVICAENSAGATPGRTTMHSVITSTANVASTSASSGFSASYDVTVSAAAT
jgi:hypothetical protein